MIKYVSLEGDVDDWNPLETMPDPDDDNNNNNIDNHGDDMDEDDDEDEEMNVQATASSSRSKGKGKGKSTENGTGTGTGIETGDRKEHLQKMIRQLTNPSWERWVVVYVSFVEDGECSHDFYSLSPIGVGSRPREVTRLDGLVAFRGTLP